MNEHLLTAKNIVVGYDKKVVIDGIDIVIPSNKISVIIGANGCGKSTLLKAFSKLITPDRGEITLDGKKINSYPSKNLAQTLGLLPQSPIVPDGITVFDLICRGRFPYRTLMKGMSKEDFEAVKEAMEIMGITELANRSVDELSGGQRQRVWIALALAQQTDILLLDEPTTFLDISYQVEILDLLTELNKKRGTTIVMVLHDINLSARYADYIFAISNGKLMVEGLPEDIISPKLIKEIFNLECSVIKDPVSNSPLVVPIGKYHNVLL